MRMLDVDWNKRRKFGEKFGDEKLKNFEKWALLSV
jgi:hypothetical protein